MKPLPVIVSITLSAPFAAFAAIVNPDGFGNVLVTTDDSGAHNIQTTFFPTPGNNEIRIDSGAFLNPAGGDVIEVQTFDASGAFYTINNNGTLTSVGGPGNHGIDTIDLAGARPNITVNNTGSITGFSAIRANNQLTLTNSGTLTGSGFADGAVFTKNGGSITNSEGGIISGNTHGIRSENVLGTLTVINNNSITGLGADGINTGGILALTNSYDVFAGGASTVTGAVNGAVGLGVGSSISNSGTITGNTGNGVQVGNNASISNLTSFFIGAISGGQISGGTNGVVAGNDLTLTNQNLGSITGTTDDGISAGNNATITNAAGATIFGGDFGITVGNDLTLTNGGSITGSTDDGVDADDSATITNQLGATITGGVDGISAGDQLTLTNHGLIQASGLSADDGVSAGAGSSVTNSGTISGDYGVYFYDGDSEITNSGTITGLFDGILVGDGPAGVIVTNSGFISGGDDAFDGDDGDDTLNLNLGSRLVGNVQGGGGINNINFGDGLTTIGGLNNSISGDVTEIATITKAGDGVNDGVAFIGLPSDTEFFEVEVDTITITHGGLYINGDIEGYNEAFTTINAGGAALGGTGEWDANIFITSGGFSAGSIPINLDSNPENAVGRVDLFGDVDHSPGSFIRFDVIPDTAIVNGVNSDLIDQFDDATYDVGGAGLRISTTDHNEVISDGVYTVVDSNEVITGTPSGLSVQFNPNVIGDDLGFFGSEVNFFANAPYTSSNTVLTQYFTSVEYRDGDTNLVLDVQHAYEFLPGLDENQSALGAALDASVGDDDDLTQDLIGALDNSSLLFVQDTLASLVPNDTLAQTSAIASSNYALHRRMQNHLSAVRSGGGEVIETPASTDAKGGIIPATTTTSGGGRGNVWGTLSYDWKDAGFDDGFDGEDASFSAGVDYRVAPNLLLGILIEGSQGDYDYTGGSSDIDSLRVAAYGTWGASTGLYSDFLIGYGNHDMDSTRALGGILFGNAGTSTEADSLQAMLTVGYNMESGCVKHGPFAGLEYQNIDVDGFTTTGAFPIGVDGYDVDSLRFLIGYRAEATYGKFTPFGSVAYAHEFEDGPIGATAFLPGGASFGVSGGGLESAFLLSLGTGYSITSNLDLNISYNGEFSTGGDGIDSHGGSIGLNYSF